MLPSRVTILVLSLALACYSQEMPKAFDVATIKPNAANDHRVMMRLQPGGRYTATGVSLKQIIGQAYNMRDFQITGGPGWIASDRYDINAKAEGLPDRVTPEQMRPLLRNLVEDRFKLKAHTENKEMPIYALVVAKGGPKLKPAANPSEGGGPGEGPRGMIRIGRGLMETQNTRMPMFVQQLSQQLGRTVVDETGLTGEYDVRLEWTPEPGQGGGGPFGGPPPPDALPAADSAGPTIFTALQEQLGLRLESKKGPVPVLVIDSVEKPTEN